MTLRLRPVRARPGLRRAFAAAFAAFQLVLAPALSVTDAAAQARSANPHATHVEDHSRAECRAAHDDACVVCQHLGAVAHAPAADAAVVLAAGRSTPATAVAPSQAAGWARARPPARAPPNLA